MTQVHLNTLDPEKLASLLNDLQHQNYFGSKMTAIATIEAVRRAVARGDLDHR